MVFLGFDQVDSSEVSIRLGLSIGLQLQLHLKASPDKAVWRSWIELYNPGSVQIDGISRFDAANYTFSTGSREPLCGYVLGWLEGPRAEAPGRQFIGPGRSQAVDVGGVDLGLESGA